MVEECMILEIEFPDGSSFITHRDICMFNSIEELAESICEEMAEAYVSSKNLKPRAIYNYVKGCIKWLYPHLLVLLKEEYESKCIYKE